MRRPGGRGRTGLAQDLDRGEVAVPGALLDVMGPQGGGRPALGERLGRALVRHEPQPRRARRVHRAAHERMAEAEPARHVARPHEVALDQLVERVEAVGLRDRRGGDREVELERLARDGGRLGEVARRVGQPLQLAGDRRRDGGRHALGVALGEDGRRVPGLAARELEEEERVAAALAVQAVVVAGGSSFSRPSASGAPERPERDPLHPALAQRPPRWRPPARGARARCGARRRRAPTRRAGGGADGR